MKKIIAIILCGAICLTACGNVTQSNNSTSADASTVSSNESGDEASDTDVVEDDEYETEELVVTDSDSIDFEISGLDDENLIYYVEDNIYTELIDELDTDEYFVENVEAIYYPKEYIDELEFNSQSNIYFGYTSAELEEQFQGTRYVFTLGDDGQTTVVPMETIDDDTYTGAMKDVAIGTGVILICVTVSVVSGGVGAPAVSMIFAASATTGTTFALSSGGLAFIASAIAKGYQTEDFEQAMKAGVEAGADGFKWGAIIGATVGGAEETIALHGATLNGLTMNEAAAIQKESGYPLELIKQFKSVEEYNIYKEAGLYTKMVNGKLALVRDIDLTYVSELPNGEKVTNLVRMQKGYAPIDPATGKAYQLHHINQSAKGTLAILTESEHQGNSAILNTIGKESEIDREAFATIRKEFWKKYAQTLL